MAQQIINIGSSANKGDGDPIRTAFDKANDNFTELYADVATLATATGTSSGGTLVVNAIQGSVLGEDSTVIVDATTSTIDASRLTGTLPAIDGSALTGVTVSSIAFADVTATPTTIAGYGITDAFDGAFGSLTGTPTTIAGYGITDAYTKAEVDSAISSSVLPAGSTQSIDIVAADSTVLVDSVNGTLNATTLTGALPAIDGSALTGITISALDGDVKGSVFADDSTLLVDGVNGQIVGDYYGTLRNTNWQAGSDSYLSIVNGGATGPGPIQIVASANLDLTTGTNSDINMSPHGSGRVKVSSGAFGIVEAANFMGHADQFMYLSSKTTGAESTHIALNSTSGVQTTLYGAVDFVSGGSVDFTGSTVTGLNVTGDITGSVFADDSTLLVDGVNGTVNISNQSINALSDVDTATIAPSRSMQPLIWDDIDNNWYPGNGISLTANLTMEDNSFIMLRQNAYINFEGSTTDGFDTKLDVVNPTANRTVRLPDADGTLALTTDIPTAYTDSDVDTHLNTSSAGTNEVLSWTGSDYDWVAQSGGGSGLQSRGTVTGTTSSLADAAEADLDITGFKSYALLAITTDRAARVRLYVTSATRTADASRAEGVDPTSDAGLIAEVITTGAQTVIISPGAFGFNLEGTPTTTIPCRVTNKSGITSTVQVDLNILQLEA